MMLYPFAGVMAIVAGLIAVPTIAFMLLALFEGFPKIRIGQIAGIVAVVAWVFGIFTTGPQGEDVYLFFSVVGLVLLFFGIWKRELRLLMSRRDDEFPGRLDKFGWFLLLTLGAPAGVWLFRSFRKAHWPEASRAGRWESAPIRAKSSPWDDEEADVASPEPAGVE